MRRLVALGVLAASLAVAVAILYGVGSRGIDAEALRLAEDARINRREALEATRDTIAARLQGLLQREGERPYYQYQALYVPPDLVSRQVAFVPSPLREAPSDPLVELFFEFRRGELTSPALFTSESTPEPSAYGRAVAPRLQALGPLLRPQLAARLERAVQARTVAGGNAAPAQQDQELDAYVAWANANQRKALELLEREDAGNSRQLDRDWQASQSRVGKAAGQYRAPEPSSQAVATRAYPFELVALGPTDGGWPAELIALRWVEVGDEAWQQGFVVRVAELQDRVVPETLARVAKKAAGYVDRSPLEFDDSAGSLTSARGVFSIRQPEPPPAHVVAATTVRPGDLAVRLAAPLEGLALLASQRDLDPEGLLSSGRLLLDGALALALAVVTLGGLLLGLASWNERLLAQRRADFVAALTHELKAPLTGLRALTELLHEDLVPDEAKRKEYYVAMLAEADRLQRLVQNVLDAAKLERGRLEVALESLDLGPLLAEVAGRYRSRFEAQGLTLQVALPDELPLARCDREAFSQVVSNLLDNAGKYGRGGEGLVRLAAANEGDALAVSVSDDGPGVPAAERGQIFERFFRSAGAPREVGGAGLGLSIARAQAQAQGGDLRLEPSERGARFVFTVPRA